MSSNKPSERTSSSSRLAACVVLCARNGDGVSVAEAQTVREFLNGADCDGWWFVPPGTFIAVFLAEAAGANRASACESKLRDLTQSWPEPLAMGRADGELVCSFTEAGAFAQMPMGIAINAAMAEAVKDAT